MTAPTPKTAPPGRNDIIVGGILLAFAIAWTVAVDRLVPAGRGFGVGPRAFPLWLGWALIALSALLLVSGLLARRRAVPAPPPPTGDELAAVPREAGVATLVWVLASVTVIMLGYGFLMQRIGFLLATAATVAVTLVLVLGERRPLVVAAMTVGIPLGCWLAFGKLLGAYMPRGSWISLF